MAPGREDSTEFGLLGPLSVTVAGSPVQIRAAKLRIVTASLLLRPGKPVSVEELVDRLWDDEPPGNGRSAIQTYVNRLRMLLGDAGRLIRTEAAGYRIDVATSAIDRERQLGHFAHARDARARGDLNAEARMLRDGLALRRGAPLADVPSRLLQLGEVPRIVEDNLQAVERLNDVELELGSHASLVGVLQSLTVEHPLRERFWAQLMLALYRSDRQADALNAYVQVNTLLREELGIEPGQQLRDLYQRILHADRALRLARPAEAAVADRWTPPFQLPADVPDFVGRGPLISQVRALFSGADPASLAVPVTGLSGPPGIGKTALAVHIAHRLRPSFPDGQLFIDLRGHANSRPMEPTEALERLLRAVGVAPEAMPHDVDEQAALLRSALADRRVLMVLDNAYGIDQVRPLLPGSRGCAVIVTSRNSLHGLAALHGARVFLVESISAEEARDLLSRIVGERRVTAEADAAAALAAACGYLPLALRIVAAKIAAGGESHAESSIDATLNMLRSGDRLAAMSVDGVSEVTVRSAFELSYSTLKPDAARLFRLLSLCPGPTFDVYAAASIGDVDLLAAEKLLESLVSTNLLHLHSPRRYQFHDLIREYARSQSLQDGDAVRQTAYNRLLAFYLHASEAACKKVYPDVYRVPFHETPDAPPEHPPWQNRTQALHWLDDEIDNLVAAIRAPSVEVADPAPTWYLAAALLNYFHEQRRDAAWQATFTAALATSERRGDPSATAALRNGLGRLHLLRTEYDLALRYYRGALDAYQGSQDADGQARALNNLGIVATVTGAYDAAIGYYRQALELYPADGGGDVRIVIMTNTGVLLHMVGQTESGTEYAAQALELARRAGRRNLAARAAAVIALKDMWLGKLEAAASGLAAVLEESRDLGNRQNVAETLRNLAEVHLEAGRLERSRAMLEQALTSAEELGFTWGIIGARVTLGWVGFHAGDLANAEAGFRAAHALALAGPRYWHSSAALGLAACHRLRCELDQAATFADTAVRDERPRERGRGHLELARIALAAGDLEEAVARADEARHIGEQWKYVLDEARALELLGTIHARRGDVSAAKDLLGRAKRAFEPENRPSANRIGRLIDEL
ncbi:MAG TPA: BTAD domain-containing putative transcriptional regulator [Actinocrinis sp.]|nr:BTAD domain-containing putative transcriptional regulator [Actinocrinis sp.]